MKEIFQTYRPDGFHTVTPYLFVDNPTALIDFLKDVFLAEETKRSINPANGDLANCILKIGDTSIMISQARGQFQGLKSPFYLFVDDVEQIHKKQ